MTLIVKSDMNVNMPTEWYAWQSMQLIECALFIISETKEIGQLVNP
jgi:hypothetical protein